MPRATSSATWALAARRDLLYRPAVPVGVLEEHEAAPREVLHLADLDAALGRGRGGAGRCAPDDLQALPRAGLGLHDPGADRDRARRARRGELHEAHLVA